MPPRMHPAARARSEHSAASFSSRYHAEYSLFGRLPLECQPALDVDSDGCSVVAPTVSRHTLRYHSSQYIEDIEKSEGEVVDQGHAGLVSSTASLVKSILGIGMVSMPYICKEAGFIEFIIFQAIFAVPSHFANICLAHAVELVLGPWNARSEVVRADYVTLGVIAFGPRAQWGVLGVFLTVVWGGTISVFIALHDILLEFVSDVPFLNNSWTLLTLVSAAVFPLCLPHTMHALRHTSILGIIGIAVMAAVIAGWAVSNGRNISELRRMHFGVDTIALLPVFTFAYMGQFNFVRVYCELKERSPHRIGIVSGVSLVLCFVFIVFLGFCGYLAFGEDAEQDLFQNLASLRGIPTQAAKVLFSLSLVFTAPMFLFEARNMIEDILKAMPFFTPASQQIQDGEDEEEGLGDEDLETSSLIPDTLYTRTFWMRRVAVVLALLTSVLCISASYPHVVQVLGLLGSTASTMLAWVLPPLLYLRLNARLRPHAPPSKLMKWCAWAFVVAGLIAMPLFTGIVVWKRFVSPS